MTPIHIDKGPYMLEIIDTYASLRGTTGYVRPFSCRISDAKDTIIRVDDARGEKVADAYCYAYDKTEAMQWLLDFVSIAADGR